MKETNMLQELHIKEKKIVEIRRFVPKNINNL